MAPRFIGEENAMSQMQVEKLKHLLRSAGDGLRGWSMLMERRQLRRVRMWDPCYAEGCEKRKET